MKRYLSRTIMDKTQQILEYTTYTTFPTGETEEVLTGIVTFNNKYSDITFVLISDCEKAQSLMPVYQYLESGLLITKEE